MLLVEPCKNLLIFGFGLSLWGGGDVVYWMWFSKMLDCADNAAVHQNMKKNYMETFKFKKCDFPMKLKKIIDLLKYAINNADTLF